MVSKVIEDTKQWTLGPANYPVALPFNSGLKESALDIRAFCNINSVRTTLIIECKKNNPEFIDWIFFPSVRRVSQNISLPFLNNQKNEANSWDVSSSLQQLPFDIVITDEARETRGQYQSSTDKKTKTKTSNAAISDAAYQVALATQAIHIEEAKFSKNEATNKDAFRMPWSIQILLPTIVTSARIYTCTFDPSEVHPATGEISYSKATLTEQPYLIYKYPLPSHLQNIPEEVVGKLTMKNIDNYIRMNIFVVQSKMFQTFLNDVAARIDTLI